MDEMEEVLERAGFKKWDYGDDDPGLNSWDGIVNGERVAVYLADDLEWTYMLRMTDFYGAGAADLAWFLAEEAPKLVPTEH